MGYRGDSNRRRRFTIHYRVWRICGNLIKIIWNFFIVGNKTNEQNYFQLVNRQNRAKLKPTMSTIYDEEIVKHTSNHRSSDYSKPVHTIWTDPDVSWNDKSFESTSNKILVDKSFQDNKKYNLYDSWRSEWNGYYYNPSHSSKYGYDSTTNLSSRHYPDYDTNF